MKRLYHYTSIDRWQLIDACGYLRPTESNLSATTEHAGPDVVWLTTIPTAPTITDWEAPMTAPTRRGCESLSTW